MFASSHRASQCDANGPRRPKALVGINELLDDTTARGGLRRRKSDVIIEFYDALVPEFQTDPSRTPGCIRLSIYPWLPHQMPRSQRITSVLGSLAFSSTRQSLKCCNVGWQNGGVS